jgi:hypothetical protein
MKLKIFKVEKERQSRKNSKKNSKNITPHKLVEIAS